MWCSSVCYSLCSEIRIKGDGWSNLLVRKLAVIYWGQQLFPLVGFLCASKLRLHQRCKFIRQWPAKNYDSEGTGAALLSVRTHYYLTHSGGPGDWWVQHDSFPSSLFHLHSVTPILHFPPDCQQNDTTRTEKCIRGVATRFPKMQFSTRRAHKYA